ncbi:hypothetical protein [Mycobacterium sp. JS623]|uniref:hypothetical protein n=1 Tax=Mycobacterium sp. JS623 TaxID=212767 RepID=UPI0002D8D23B|nr:hypothetical protein [Mycobacterium sp. JS623]
MNVPSNPDARVLSAKAFQDGLDAILSGKSFGGDGAMLQAIHDASVHLGADCVDGIVGLDDDLSEDAEDGSSEGANKAVALRLRLKGLSR